MKYLAAYTLLALGGNNSPSNFIKIIKYDLKVKLTLKIF